ncbi:MAG: hypothetical protein R3F61_38025 [Myxococcota bacterium]
MSSIRFVLAAPAALTIAFSLACYGGASLDGNEAGSDGWLDHTPPAGAELEATANDGRCDWLGRPYVSVSVERVYTLMYSDHSADCGPLNTADRKVVYSIHPSLGAEPLIDVSGLEDVRLLDTSAGLLLMGETPTQGEHLWTLDHDTLEILAEDVHDVRYWGTRTSPSRRWVAAGDNGVGTLDLHVVDPATLDTLELDDDAVWAEAQWLDHDDRLVSLSFDGTYATARLELWDLRGATSASGFPVEPVLSTLVSGVSPNLLVSYSWIGIDPLDRFAVFPVHGIDAGESMLLVQDVRDGSVRTVAGVDGPLRFTPDGSTIVGWSVASPGTLVLVDPITLDTTTVDLPMDGLPEYVMGFDGNQLLIADAWGGEDLVIYDLDADASVVLPFTASLQTWTTRGNDVYLVDADRLLHVDMDTATAEQVDLPWTPRHVVWAPVGDVLYVDDRMAPRARFLDPETFAVRGSQVLIPDAVPQLDLSEHHDLERDEPVSAGLLARQ